MLGPWATAWTRDTRPAEVRRLLADPSPSVRAAAVRRLAGRSERDALGVVLRALADAHPYVRSAAAGVLGQVVETSTRRTLRRRIGRLREVPARAHATATYVVWADAEGEAGLLVALGDGAPAVRIAALDALVDLAPAHFVERATALLADRDGGVRAAAVDCHVHWQRAGTGPARALDQAMWQRLRGDPDPRVRLAALEGSVATESEEAKVAVARGLADAVWSVRLRAAELSVRRANRQVVEQLVATLDDERRRVRAAAHAALVTLTGIPFEPDPARWAAWLEGDGRTFDPSQVDPDTPAAAQPKRPKRTETVEAVRFLGVPIVSQHVVFVLDASGSMRDAAGAGRTRWEVVRAELAAVLDGLLQGKDRVHVGLVRFADGVERPYEGLRRLTPGLRRELLADLAATRPAGRTALYDGIAAALADPAVGQVVVLSDGAPSTGTHFTKTALLQGVRRANRFRRARIDVVAVAADRVARRWRDVLARIVKEAGGTLVRR
ncbi:MAG: HEAT repeat domain-containing protein [Planctomycetota bacterium]|nr:HEAT repeat domain-containing protein [Planctomycetota bacterium]